jgi:hypothetical protein
MTDDFIPINQEKRSAPKNSVVNEEVIASAIASVVQMARQQQQSLEQLTESILRDDRVLDPERRKWLSQMIIQAWNILPLQEDHNP